MLCGEPAILTLGQTELWKREQSEVIKQLKEKK